MASQPEPAAGDGSSYPLRSAMSFPTETESLRRGLVKDFPSADYTLSPRSEDSHAGVKRKHTEVLEYPVERKDSPSKKTCDSNRFVILKHTAPEFISDHICEPVSQIPSNVDEPHDKAAPEVKWEDYFGSWPPMIRGSSSSRDRPRDKGKSPARAMNTPSSSASSAYKRLQQDAPSPPGSSRSGSSSGGYWTRRHEELMRLNGMEWDASANEIDPTSESLLLISKLKTRTYSLPEGPEYEGDRLNAILEIAKRHNETRLVRDITPLLAPPPENLHQSKWFKLKRTAREQKLPLHNAITGLEHICETIDMLWIGAEPICGPIPKPDVVMGIYKSAFDVAEKRILTTYNFPHSPTLFPEDMYFPFFICEAKPQDEVDNEDLQSMHAASIACRALWRFHERIGQETALDKQILLFSMTHNALEVNIWGHFVAVGLDRANPNALAYRRHLVFNTNIKNDFGQLNWDKTYHIVRGIYDQFYPVHLARIKAVITTMLDAPDEVRSLRGDEEARRSRALSSSTGSNKRPADESSKLQLQMVEMERRHMEEMKAQAERHVAAMEKAIKTLTANHKRDMDELRAFLSSQQIAVSQQSRGSQPSQDSRTSHSTQGDKSSHSRSQAASQLSRRVSPPPTSRDPSVSLSQDVDRPREVRPQQSFQSHLTDNRRPSPPREVRPQHSLQSYPVDNRRPSPAREGYPPEQRRPSPPYDNRPAHPTDRAYALHPQQHQQQSSGAYDNRGQLQYPPPRGQMPYPPDRRSPPR